MSAYHEAAFTLDPTVAIPADAAPAVGVDEAGSGDQIQQASEQLVADAGVRLDVAVAGTEATFTLTGDLIEPYDVEWTFGNGHHETGHDLVQSAIYAPGVYQASAVIRQTGQASLDVSATVVV